VGGVVGLPTLNYLLWGCWGGLWGVGGGISGGQTHHFNSNIFTKKLGCFGVGGGGGGGGVGVGVGGCRVRGGVAGWGGNWVCGVNKIIVKK